MAKLKLSSFFDKLSEEGENPIKTRFGSRIGGQLVDSDIQLHRGADKTLKESVVKIPRNPRAFGEAFLKLHPQKIFNLPDATGIRERLKREMRQRRMLKRSSSG